MFQSSCWYINGLYSSIGEIDSTVKPVYKGHSKGHENVHFMSMCSLPVYTGSNHMHYDYSLMGKWGCTL